MYDGIFIINSALNVNQLSVFNNEERFEQTCNTLRSIEKHCPNSIKVIFDSSPNPIDDKYLTVIASFKDTWLLDMGSHEYVKLLSLNGLRSQAECYSFIGMLQWLKQQNFKSKRIYKLSGRYTLTNDFVLDDPSYSGAFVFAEALDSWLSKGTQELCGTSKLYRLRLWHMDFKLLDLFEKELPAIFEDCTKYNIDVEHSYWKHLHKYKIVEVEKIGVEGIIAPSGEYINE